MPAHWYPEAAGLAQRASVDAALHWQHSTLRVGSMKLCWHTVLARNMGQSPNPVIAQDGAAMLRAALLSLESYWLAGGPYMAGCQDISLADLVGGMGRGLLGCGACPVWGPASSAGGCAAAAASVDCAGRLAAATHACSQHPPAPAAQVCCCELEQLRVLEAAEGAPTLGALLEPHPRVAAWMARVQQRCGQAYSDAHGKLAASVERMKQRRQQARSRL